MISTQKQFYNPQVYGDCLKRVRDNAMVMFGRRGYDVDSFVEEFVPFVDSKLGVVLRLVSNCCKILTVFVQNAKVNIELVNKLLTNATFRHLVIFYQTALTPDASRALSENVPDELTIETFSYSAMMFDPVSVVPVKYSQLPNSSRPREWHKLPKIHESDAIAKYYGFKKNNVIRIDDGVEISYRVCV